MIRKPRKKAPPCPTEADEQKVVAAYLDRIGVRYCHVPNGSLAAGSSKGRFAKLAKMKAMGQKPGVPDLLIFDPPPADKGKIGAAIEMKRRKGGKVEPEQHEWLDALDTRKWACAIAHGAEEAIKTLTLWGYA